MARHWFKRSVLSLSLTLLCAAAASADVVQPRLVRVQLGPHFPVNALLQAGLDVVEVRGGIAMVLEWPGDASTLTRLGAKAEIADEAPGRTAALKTQAELAGHPAPQGRSVKSASRSDGVVRTETLPPFGAGSLGGYWTLSEIKMKLDDLVASDIHDVVADRIDTIGYSSRFPIWGLKLGKRVTGPDNRPVVFLNALTHAREPEGMQTLFYFVDDLLSRYGVDPFATYLLDHRQIYIVPLVNPDGYKVNEDTYFNNGGTSFGLWRKNTRDNNGNQVFDNQDGVDLNRNYGYKWGFDDSGSSPNQQAETYRGPSAFSEPETRAQRDIVTQLKPVTGFSFHTYLDLLLHPWGYTNDPVPDISAFREWSDELSRENAYLTGQSPHVLYPVNGEFNDWCYGDTSKPKAFTWTPEVGSSNDGFWPPPSRIVPLAQENLRACYVVAALAGPWVQEDGVDILEGAMNAGRPATLNVRARNLGVTGTAGPGLTGTLVPLDPGIRMLTGSVGYPTLGSRVSGNPLGYFQVAADDTVTPGRLIRFEIDFSAPDGFFSRDTIAIPCGTPTIVRSDNASSGLGQWSPGTWGIVTGDPEHPSRYFADSPVGDYGLGVNNIMQLATPLNLSAGVHAYAFYEAKWEIEQNFDATFLEASLDGATWTALNTTGTTPGSGVSGGVEPLGIPLYAGARRLWKPERADLSAFTGSAGNAVRLRYRLQSDGGTQYDGFDFDSLRIVDFDPAAQPAPVAVGPPGSPRVLELDAPSPNPARGSARFGFALPDPGASRLDVFDLQGRHMRTLVDGVLAARRYVHGWDLKDETGHRVPPGLYLARLSSPSGMATRRFAVLD